MRRHVLSWPARSLLLALVGWSLATRAPAASALQGQARLEGAGGVPLLGARISLDLEPADGTPELETTADAFGLFSIPDVPAGAYRVTVEHPATLPFVEDGVAFDGTATVHRTVELTPLVAGTTIDVYVHVSCTKTYIPLAGAQVTVRRWLGQDDGGPPDSAWTIPADRFGDVTLSAVPTGFYSFRVTRPGWETLEHPAGPPLFFGASKAVTMALKPVPATLKVTVQGDDVTLGAPNVSGLGGVLVEITGLALAADDEVIPTRADLTTRDGIAIFRDLPPIRWRVQVSRRGYERVELVVPPDANGHFPDQVVNLVLQPTALRVELSHDYRQASLLQGARAILDGIKAAGTEGIHREELADAGGVVTIPRLVPGRFRLRVEHEKAVTGLPAQSGTLPPGPASFTIRYEARELNVDVEDNQTTRRELHLEPRRAKLRVHLTAADRLTEPAHDYSHDVRELHAVQHSGVELVEHAGVDLLPAGAKVTSFATDAAGDATVLVLPGRYGLRIPGLPDYSGHDVVRVDLKNPGAGAQELGWPYPAIWPWPGFESGHHAAWQHFSSDDEIDLQLHLHRNRAIFRATVVADPSGDPCLEFAVADRVNATAWTAAARDIPDAGMGTVTGTVTRSVPLVKKGKFTFEAIWEDLPPGSFTFSVDHPRFAFNQIPVTVAPFTSPGVPPSVSPGSESYWFPTVSHPLQTVLQGHYASPGTITFHVEEWQQVSDDPPQSAYVPWGDYTGADYIKTSYSGAELCRPNSAAAPAGAYTVWREILPSSWFTDNGPVAGQVFNVYIGGELNNISADRRPPLPPSYELTVRSVWADDPKVLVPNVTLTFSDGSTLSTGATGERTVEHRSQSPDVTSASAPLWFLDHVEGETVALAGRKLRVTAFLHRQMLVDGRVRTMQGGAARNLEGIAVEIKNRNGSTLRELATDDQGRFSTTLLRPETVFVEVRSFGFVPRRLRFAPASGADPDAHAGDILVTAVPPPPLQAFTADRHGLFVPGVSKTGNALGFSPDAAQPSLTATFAVQCDETRLAYSLQGYDGRQGARSIVDYDVEDPVREVFVVDRRWFDQPFLNDDSQVERFVEPPCGPVNVGCDFDSDEFLYRDVRPWLDDIRRGTRAGQPYQVFHGVDRERDPDGLFRVPFQLWNLTSGKLDPVVVIVTAHGGVRLASLPVATNPANGKPHEPLRGLRLPAWSSSVLNVIGMFSNGVDAKGFFPKKRILPIPKFEGAIAKDGEGYLTYEYSVAAELKEGAAAPESGPVAFATRHLGWTLPPAPSVGPSEVGGVVRFRVRGVERDVSLGIGASVSTSADDKLKAHSPRWLSKVLGDVTPKDGKWTITARLDHVEKIDTNWLEKYKVPDFRLKFTAGTSLGGELRFNLRPFIERFSMAAPGAGQMVGAAISLGDRLGVLVISAALPLKLGGNINLTEETYLPVVPSTVTTEQPEEWHLLGGTHGGALPTPSADITLMVGLGLNFDLGSGTLEGQGGLQLGSPANLRLGGVKFDFDLTKWPIIKRLQGALSLYAKAKLNLLGVAWSRSFQYDLLTFDQQFGTEAWASVVDLNLTNLVLTPALATSGTFRADGAPLVGGLYGAGGFDAAADGDPLAGRPPLVAFTDVDEAADRMTVEVTLLDGSSWTEPVRVATAGAVLGLAVAPAPEGGWLLAWIEVAPDDVGKSFAPTRVMWSRSDASGQTWTAPAALAELPDVGAAPRLAVAGGQVVLAMTASDEGPTASQSRVLTATWNGAAWSPLAELLPKSPLAGLALAGNGASAGTADATLAVLGEGADLRAWRWNGAQWTGPALVDGDARARFDASYGADGVPLIAGVQGEGSLVLWRRNADGTWSRLGAPVAAAGPGDVELVPVDGPAWLVAWTEGGSTSNVFDALVRPDGSPLRAPARRTACAPGVTRDLDLAGVAGTSVTWVARMDAASNDLQVLALPTDGPAAADADGDGVGDACDLCPGGHDPFNTDVDGDGAGDACDPCPVDAPDDTDGDGACDSTDNCAAIANPAQADADADGEGNACEPCTAAGSPDADGDTRCDADDNCLSTPNLEQQDADGDGRGDACDPCPSDALDDPDGDGVCQTGDNCPAVANPSQSDLDGDGQGDACDLDVVLVVGSAFTVPTNVDVDVPLVALVSPGRCVKAAQFRLGFDPARLAWVGVVAPRDGCSVGATAAAPGAIDVVASCPAGVAADAVLASLRLHVPALAAPEAMPLAMTLVAATQCGEGGAASAASLAGGVVAGAVPGDVFPDGVGDGTVSLADFVLLRRKVLGLAGFVARDGVVADLAPGTVTCAPSDAADSWCRQGGGGVNLADAVALRRLVSGVQVVGCAPCAPLAARGPGVDRRLPGDVAPAQSPDGRVDVTDVVRALRLAVGLDAAADEVAGRADVAPVAVEGAVSVVAGNGRVDVADVTLLLRASVGLATLEWPERALALELAEGERIVGARVELSGVPRWARPIGLDGCGEESDVALTGEGAWIVTCVTDPLLLAAPAPLAIVRYRAPEPIDPSAIAVESELLTASLAAADGRVVVRGE